MGFPASSWLISNTPCAFEPQHAIHILSGLVIKQLASWSLACSSPIHIVLQCIHDIKHVLMFWLLFLQLIQDRNILSCAYLNCISRDILCCMYHYGKITKWREIYSVGMQPTSVTRLLISAGLVEESFGVAVEHLYTSMLNVSTSYSGALHRDHIHAAVCPSYLLSTI